MKDSIVVLVLRIIDRLSRLLVPVPPPPSLTAVALIDLPRRRKEIVPMDIGNKFYNQVGGIHVVLSANDELDAPGETTTDQPDMPVSNVSEDGLTFDVAFPERNVPLFTITTRAKADNPNTPDEEFVTHIITGSLSHSKATLLTGNVTDIPR